MATRLERAFGADAQQLLELQAAFDRGQRRGAGGVAVRAFVPGFLTIKAAQIQDWAANSIDARTHLPVLLRKLVHSTGAELRLVDFPGYDNAQRQGADGRVEAHVPNPWIPEGRSYWEFGTDQNPLRKANQDYADKVKSVTAGERASGTFIFVTPRNWPGKTAWENQKREAGDWKSVRAFDASDLEQWLDQSVPTQIWFADLLNLPTHGFETLEQGWHRWASVTDPPLIRDIFAPAVAAHMDTFKDWLSRAPEKPFVVAADSHEEAVAFLSCLFDGDEMQSFRDRAAVFFAAATLKTLVASSVPFIPIVYSADVERELVDAHRRTHCIIFRPRNAIDTAPDIALDLLNYDAFEKGLRGMGVNPGDVERLSRESGRSPTILRRRLATVGAIRRPVWADSDSTVRVLVPLALVGAWHGDLQADREIVARVAGRAYDQVEGDLVQLLSINDSPVWAAGGHRGVVSKIDALFSVAGRVTSADLDRFFSAAENVLAEADPALELPDEQRWSAAIYGKTRAHSSALRDGLCDTLVLLSVHGNHLFQDRLGIDMETRVALLVRSLLTPLTLAKLLSQDDELPRYAEAAPDEFLSLLESDLGASKPIALELLKPVDGDALWASPTRVGLLWALECLGWNPTYLPRVSLILAQLSTTRIDDNWGNRPDASLRAIFRAWMPQTAASMAQRVKALELLAKRSPEVAWDVWVEQIKPGSRFGSASYRPRWRSDASGAGQPVTHQEAREFCQHGVNRLLAWPSYNEKTLGDLVECLQTLLEPDQLKVWDLIGNWSEEADDAAKASLRERIRRYAFTRRGNRRRLSGLTLRRAREIFVGLEAPDPVVRHTWLFLRQWVEDSADERETEELDYRQRDQRIDALRHAAMAEICTGRGFDGVTALMKGSSAASTIGRYVASCVTTTDVRAEFIHHCLGLELELRPKAEACLGGFLWALDDESREVVLTAAAATLPVNDRKRLFLSSPFRATTWRRLDDDEAAVRAGYWQEVVPCWEAHNPAELTEIVDCLLEARRPRAAFHTVQMSFKDLETSRLRRLLRDVTTVDTEPRGSLRLEPYYIAEALTALEGRPGVTQEEMAQLEFLYIDALTFGEHGIPNLEKQIAQAPELFVQAVAMIYLRDDAGEDPPVVRVDDPERRAALASAAYRVLDQIRLIPGQDATGKIDPQTLITWLRGVRDLCQQYARVDAGDLCLGQLLARGPAGGDGMWPCEPICEAMESIASAELGRGFAIGVFNARGVHGRGDGGAQERELAAKYRAWAEHLHFDYPYVGGVLEDIARSYERDAGRQDAEARVRKRLRN